MNDLHQSAIADKIFPGLVIVHNDAIAVAVAAAAAYAVVAIFTLC